MKIFFSCGVAIVALCNTLSASLETDASLDKTFCYKRKKHLCPTGPTGPTGPIGSTGPTGSSGSTGSTGPGFSNASSSFAMQVTFAAPVAVNNGENFPFTDTDAVLLSDGITYDSVNHTFSFAQSGRYLVSYGAMTSVSNALIALFYDHNPTGGTEISKSRIYFGNSVQMTDATLVIPITSSQTLSLVNVGINFTIFSNALGAFITIVRVGDLP